MSIAERRMIISAENQKHILIGYSEENQKANKASDSAGEIIGFNHKSGKYYSAHVAFADGHCVKLVLPDGATEDNLKELTTWLCTGVEYTFNGSKYEKVSE